MSCLLCLREKKTYWFINDENWWVVEDLDSHNGGLTILAVLKEHKPLSQWTKQEKKKAKTLINMIADRHKLKIIKYDYKNKTIPKHGHI